MPSLTKQLGLWSASLMAIDFVVFTICFVLLATRFPLFIWSDFPTYLAYVRQHDRSLAYLAQAGMLLMGPLYLILLSCLFEGIPKERHILLRIALALGIGFAVLTGMNYFTQITTIRFNIARGTVDGLEHFLQAKPDSIMAGINMLGWTIYFGLSSLVAGLAFRGDRLNRAIRLAFVANGAFCLLAGFGFVLDNAPLIFITINLGMGGAVLAIAILLMVYFRRMA